MFKAVVAALAFLALSLPAAAQEPTRTERAATLIAASAWGESQVIEYIRLFHTQEGRAALLPATSTSRECERQVAALDDLRRRLQADPSIGDSLTEYRLAGMREHAVQVGACSGIVAQIDRLTVVRRTLATATITQVASTGATCDFDTWRWDSPVCASNSIASNAVQRYTAFFESSSTTQCQLSTVWRLARANNWEPGVFMTRHYLETRFDGRVLDEAACGRIVIAAAG